MPRSRRRSRSTCTCSRPTTAPRSCGVDYDRVTRHLTFAARLVQFIATWRCRDLTGANPVPIFGFVLVGVLLSA
jgi:hypothetical protein